MLSSLSVICCTNSDGHYCEGVREKKEKEQGNFFSRALLRNNSATQYKMTGARKNDREPLHRRV